MRIYTLKFLDAYLKHENGVPPHMMKVDFRAAKGTPATFEALRFEAGDKGFDHLADVYAAMKKEKPDFKVGETAMYVWATELKDDGQMADAINVLKLELQIYPDSSDAYLSLGEAYEKSGEKQLAVESYRKALEKNAKNSSARERLTALEGAPTTK